MGMIRAIRKVAVWGLFLYAMTVLAVVCFSILKPIRAASDFATSDVIVVLGGGVFVDGGLDTATELRVARGVQLFEAGIAPRLHMTAGPAQSGSAPGGESMKRLAVALGVPEAAITAENASQSTLQNAIFSLPALSTAQSTILVTEAFHLPRAWASFRWAGAEQDIQLAVSTRFRWDQQTPWRSALSLIFREAAAWWFNIARATVYSLAGLMGLPEEDRIPWLA